MFLDQRDRHCFPGEDGAQARANWTTTGVGDARVVHIKFLTCGGGDVARDAIAGWRLEAALKHGWMLLLGWGCSDYTVSKREATEAGTDEVVEDSAAPEAEEVPPDPPSPADTGDDGIDEEVPEDTGEEPVVEVPEEPVYVHTAESLFGWEPTTGVLTRVNDFNDGVGGDFDTSMTDIAIDGEGNFFGVSFDGLHGIDPVTAAVWDIATMDMDLVGLAATSDGRLIGAGDGLYEINTTTGQTTELVRPGVFETSGDVVGLPDRNLYWLVRSADETAGDRLVVVDPTSADSRVVGAVGLTSLYGVSYAAGALYGFSDLGEVIEIDPDTAEVLSISNLDYAWWGATTNPVVWETED